MVPIGPVTIKVKQEHIDKGQKTKHGFCPIALAAHEQFPGAKPSVGAYNFFFDTEEESSVAKMPKIAYQFVCDFDSGLPVIPFEFTTEFKEA